jgi:hypothetical protein
VGKAGGRALSAKVAQHVERDDQWDPWHEYIHVHQHCDAGFARSTGSFLAPESDCCTSFLCHDELTSNVSCCCLLLQSPIRVSGNAHNDSGETWKTGKTLPRQRGPLQCVNVASSCLTGGGGSASVKRYGQQAQSSKAVWIAGSPGKPLIRRGKGRAGGDKERISPDIRTSHFNLGGTKHQSMEEVTVTLNCQVGMRHS